MALTINPATKVITIPQSDLTPVAGTLYELDTNQFRRDVMALMDDEDYIWMDNPFIHNTEVTVAGTTFARTIEFVNGYSVEFENGSYTVRLSGSNNNIFDVENGILVQNSVQVIAQNSAGLIAIQQIEAMVVRIGRIVGNRLKDNGDGTATIYADDGLTPLYTLDPFLPTERGGV